ncbi:MAG: hypothetical protein ACRYGC_17315 [Janthinobacterium lividum]
MTDYQTRAAVRAMQEITQAQQDVAPVVGSVPAMDSAAGVYGAALARMGVTPKDIRAVSGTTAGARTMFQIVRDRQRGTGRPMVAMDAAGEARRKAMFPHGDRFS